MSTLEEIEKIIFEKEAELRACNQKMIDYRKKLSEEADNFRNIENSIANLKSGLSKIKENVTVF